MFSKFNKLGIVPTDTVYGLICIAEDKTAIEKIYDIKNRPKNKQMPIIVQDINMLKQIADVSKNEEEFIKAHHDKGFSFLVKLKNQNLEHLSLNGKISVRVLSNKHLHEVFKSSHKPIVATSANISGQSDVSKSAKLSYDIISKVDFCIPDDSCIKFDKSSTVIDVETQEIIREGAGKVSQTSSVKTSKTKPEKKTENQKVSEEVKTQDKPESQVVKKSTKSSKSSSSKNNVAKTSNTKPAIKEEVKKETQSNESPLKETSADTNKKTKPISARKLKTKSAK